MKFREVNTEMKSMSILIESFVRNQDHWRLSIVKKQ